MKNLFIVCAFLFSATAALACDLPEAQFIGKVADYSKSDCSYKISFVEYNESGVCGLHMDDADYVYFTDASCSLKNGDEVSGFLIMREDGKVEIE